MRILGIDPGIRNTGWGLVEMASGHLRHIANGVIQPDPGAADTVRLQAISAGLDAVIASHAPDRAAIEAIFVSRSAASALKLGMARGVAMERCGSAGLDVDEIAARQVKKAVVGTGTADKTQVTAMVTRLLGIAPKNNDSADALAIAIAAGHGDGRAGSGSTAGTAGAPAGGAGLGAAIEAALARDAAADHGSGGKR
jgi:crossover junction endodeoxyribonuclease RuvC